MTTNLARADAPSPAAPVRWTPRWHPFRTAAVALMLATSLVAIDLVGPSFDGILPSPTAPSPVAAAIPSAAGPCIDGWQDLPIPNRVFISTPFEILTRNGRPAWVVGGSNQGILSLKWNGSRWKRVSTGTRGHRGIVGASLQGKSKVLGVGYFRAAKGEGMGSLTAIGGRLVSGNWKQRPLPDAPGPRATLTDVVHLPGGKALAVGTRLDGGRLRAYAARLKGRHWSRQEPSSGSGAGLLAIERTPKGAIWTVGWKESSVGKPRPYIARRKGNGWKRIPAARVPAGSAVLTDIHFISARAGWAVGYLTRKGSDRPEIILQRWNGERWRNVSLPWAGDFGAVARSVSVGGGGEIWIAGTQTATNGREPRGFVAHLRNGSWGISALGVPSGVRSEVMAVAATKNGGAVAAANVGASLLMLRTCGGGPAAAGARSGARAGRDASDARIRVRNMKLRRETQDEDLFDAFDASPAESVADGPTAFGVATERTLAAPVKPSGFVVRDMAGSAGLASSSRTYDGFTGDLDGNGWRDVFYSRHGGTLPRLAMNGSGSFHNASNGAFSPVDRHGCDMADVDNDGDNDILCAVGASRGSAVQRHELSLSPYNGQRELMRGGMGILDPLGRGRHVGFIRLDKDRFPEAFIGNAPDRNDGLPAYNRFYRNNGGRFVPAPGVGLDASHGASCVETGDFDGDGDQDLVYCTQYSFGGRPAGLRFMRNQGGKLRDRTRALGISPMGDIDVAFADVTGDGRRDLVQLSPSALRVSKRTKKGFKRIHSVRISHAWAVAAGDASGDDRADIYVVRGNDKANKPDRLLVSRKHGRRFVSVRIPQTRKGSADDVVALDYDRNGRTDFVILNGRRSAGPIQLLASFRD